jgi:hypothetical protein
MTAHALLAAALVYAARGWRVHPLHEPIANGARCTCGDGPACKSKGKHPRVRDWTHVATTDEATIRAWWARWPTANIGIATGADSGLVVLDVDTGDAKRGDRTLVALVRDHGPLLVTPEVTTGSGGAHYYFAHPGGRLGNSAGKLGEGLDTRGDGGFVVAPPSTHASGSPYGWARCGVLDAERRRVASSAAARDFVEGAATWDQGVTRYVAARLGELAPLPSWLLALLRPAPALPRIASRPPTYAKQNDREDLAVRAAAYLDAMPPSIAGQRGHDALWAAAVAMVRGFDLDEGDALDLLEHVFNPRCLPPWSRRELQHKVRSASRADRAGRGYLLRRGAA